MAVNGLPKQLAHLKWKPGVFTPKAAPEKKIPFVRAMVQIDSDDEDGEDANFLHVEVMATRYPQSFTVMYQVIDIVGGYDIEDYHESNRVGTLYKGTVEGFDRDFSLIRDRARAMCKRLFPYHGDYHFDGWMNPPQVWGEPDEEPDGNVSDHERDGYGDF